MKSYETYNSHEMGQYVRFCLFIACPEDCKKCRGAWSFGKDYPSDHEKYFGFPKKGLEVFF